MNEGENSTCKKSRSKKNTSPVQNYFRTCEDPLYARCNLVLIKIKLINITIESNRFSNRYY